MTDTIGLGALLRQYWRRPDKTKLTDAEMDRLLLFAAMAGRATDEAVMDWWNENVAKDGARGGG